jgi:hypothetical protein
MKIAVAATGLEFEGTPVEIIQFLREKVFEAIITGRTDQYINWLRDALKRLGRISIRVTGDTTEQRAASLVDGMITRGI